MAYGLVFLGFSPCPIYKSVLGTRFLSISKKVFFCQKYLILNTLLFLQCISTSKVPHIYQPLIVMRSRHSGESICLDLLWLEPKVGHSLDQHYNHFLEYLIPEATYLWFNFFLSFHTNEWLFIIMIKYLSLVFFK